MSIKLGNTALSKAYFGTTEINKLYLGSNLVFQNEPLAFPTAFGGGAYITGGRGGQVIKVTNLNDSGAGSFREACLTQGARIITFDVSGTINLLSRIDMSVSRSDLTIAGQTAPEGGITITGFPLQVAGGGWECDNVIIRYIRFRNGNRVDAYDSNGLLLQWGDGCYVDHCSFSYCGDKGISVGNNGVVNNLTIARCLFTQNATGILVGLGDSPDTTNVTVAKNLFVTQSHRTPNVGGIGVYDIYNNVIFNFATRTTNVNGFDKISKVNYFNNWMRRGDSSTDLPPVKSQFGNSELYDKDIIYTANNYHDSLALTPTLDDQQIWSTFQDGNVSVDPLNFTTTKHPMVGKVGEILSAADAYTDVSADAGHNRYLNLDGTVTEWTDTLDSERLSDILTFTSRSIYDDAGGVFPAPPVLPTNTRPVGYDTSGDGMPDVWKTAQGLNPATDDSLYDWGNGYIGCEQYLNEIDLGTVVVPTELYTSANVVSLDPNEANSLTGITEVGAGALSIVTGSGATGSSAYYAKLIGSGGSSERIEVAWSGLTIGNDYTFSFYVKKVGVNGYLNNWTNVTSVTGGVADPEVGGALVFVTEEAWTKYSYPLRVTSTSGIARFYASSTLDSEIHVDSFSIILLSDNS